jgi:hypothetical protein
LPDAAAPPTKRSGHVALLMMGAFAVGGAAYTLMPGQSCQPPSPGLAAPGVPQANAGCTPRSSSSGGGGSSGYSRSSRLSFFGGGSSSAGDPASPGVTRGGFGSFARAFGFGSGS